MAVARMVMQEWSEGYSEILRKAGVELTLFKGYVDEVRQISMPLQMGMRFDEMQKEFRWSEDAEKEDLRLATEEGEHRDAPFARPSFQIAFSRVICLYSST